jgi:hypothetical protein
MTPPPGAKIRAPPLVWPGGKAPPKTLQRAGAEAVFAAHARGVRAAPPPRAVAEELVARPGGGFQLRSAQRHTMSPPTGTFNFVRIHGETPRSRPVLVSAQLAHAQMAGGRPVVYAGTARFERGEMAWWSNYSGTYQPIAAFRAQAGLPEDKFVPWQKLQMGGTAMQRGTFTERRAAESAAMPDRPADAAKSGPANRAGVTGAEPKPSGSAVRTTAPVRANGAGTNRSGGSEP